MDSAGVGVDETEIHGTVAPGYEPVRDAFAENFAERNEIGASVAVVADGKPMVKSVGGLGGSGPDPALAADTLTNVWSTTKPMTSICAHILMDRVGLDPDAPVARYWPEFAAAGKADIPLRWLMSHRAGLAGLAVPVTAEDFRDWEKITSLLAAQEPMWEPGMVSGYHAVTFGYLAGEVVRRVSGQSLGQFFVGEVAGPLGALTSTLGCPRLTFGGAATCRESSPPRRSRPCRCSSMRMPTRRRSPRWPIRR